MIEAMRSKILAIRECARLWREEESRAIDMGDAARAAYAEKCAQRFDEYLPAEQSHSTRPRTRSRARGGGGSG
jgi:hypothetical protein